MGADARAYIDDYAIPCQRFPDGGNYLNFGMERSSNRIRDSRSSSNAGRGARILSASGALALRKFFRGELVFTGATAAGFLQCLCLLPYLG